MAYTPSQIMELTRAAFRQEADELLSELEGRTLPPLAALLALDARCMLHFQRGEFAALREGFALRRPAQVPEAPTHASLVAAARASAERAAEARAVAVDDVTGRSPYETVESGESR